MEKKAGILFTGISAACFGFLPIFAALSYKSGGNSVTVIAIRFLIATAILWGIVLFKGKDYKIGRKKIIQMFMLGVFGYISTTAAYFTALNYISAPLVALLFYTNPIIVCILSYFIFKEEINRNKAIALGLSALGLMLIVGLSLGSIDVKGVLLAFLAAFLYSGYIMAGDKIVKGIDPVVTTTYVTSACASATVLFGMITNSFVKINAIIFAYGSLMAIFSTVIAILFFFEGIKRIGGSQVAIISTIEPMVTVLMSALLLGDNMNLPQILGGTLIVVGIIILQRPVKIKE